MKSILLLLTLGVALLTTGCYSNTTKESGTDSTEKTAPMPSRSGGY